MKEEDAAAAAAVVALLVASVFTTGGIMDESCAATAMHSRVASKMSLVGCFMVRFLRFPGIPITMVEG
jgi:hypothetical protein